MRMTNPNDSAFMRSEQYKPNMNANSINAGPFIKVSNGLTKREYFAAMALQGLITNGWRSEMAKTCVEAADALITALNTKNTEDDK